MFHYRSESTPRGRDPENVRTLAAERGYRAERAARRNHWQLFRADGTAAIDPRTRSTAFSFADAIAFLTSPAGSAAEPPPRGEQAREGRK